jgi:hypothetical protein
MLNGISPIIIFTTSIIPLPSGSPLSGIPIVGDLFSTGIPIPIYLDEQRTGIVVDSETTSIDIDTTYEGNTDTSKKSLNISQVPIDNIVTINLVANRNSLLLTVLSALSEEAFKKAVSKQMTISYLNGTTVIFGAKLRTFATNVSADDDLIRVSIQLSKGDEERISARITELPKSPTPGIGAGGA